MEVVEGGEVEVEEGMGRREGSKRSSEDMLVVVEVREEVRLNGDLDSEAEGQLGVERPELDEALLPL